MPILGIMASQISGHLTVASTIFVANGASPYIQAYPFASATGIGTKYANPASLPTDGVQVDYNVTNNTVVVSTASTPYVVAYPWSAGFGTR